VIQWRGLVASLTVALIVASSVACSRSTPPSEESSTLAPTSTMGTAETGESQPPTQTSGTEPTETDGASPTGTETDGDQNPTGASPTDGSGTTAVGPEVDPAGPDLTLYTLPECSVVPGGALSGADALTMLVAVRNSGPGSWNSLVPFRVSSDTGLSSQGNTALSTGSAFTAMQVDLTTADYSRTHRFTITADPNNQIRESDETNNDLVISVALPPRPTGTTNITCSSP
jgi:hypothetical protein